MGTADILITIFIVIFGLKGFQKGFIAEAVAILGLIIAFLFSYMIYPPIYEIVNQTGIDEKIGSILSYIIGFFTIYIAVFIIGRILNKFIIKINLGDLNRVAGFIFGGLKGAVIMSVILWAVILLLSPTSKIIKDIDDSVFASKIILIPPTIYDYINNLSGIDRLLPFTNYFNDNDFNNNDFVD